ncbi:MAG: hypothetical protein GTO18_02320 [Anaerolineales bacterium]|nr:hypothetical protein [Anaerolineales bacterium]
MIGLILLWWVTSTVIGLITFPIGWRIFSRLPDRGYGLIRTLGLLISGYFLWLAASLGIMQNSLGGVIGSLILLAGVAYFAGRKSWSEMWEWVKGNWGYILAAEILFFVAFTFWAFVRANNPEILHTEKPMELAFLNAILHSDSFPPKDPWLSGYGISYYYFGYVILAFLTRLTGVASSEAFNLGNALWFALACIGAYSILYNLFASAKKGRRLFASLLGPIFILITGNLEVLLDVLHHRQFFWQGLAEGTPTSAFWTWLNLGRLSEPPTTLPTWVPDRFLWWWQASRVVQDVNLSGRVFENIDEFPFFSFLLADNHPHILAIPFVLLAISYALHVFLARYQGAYRVSKVIDKDRPYWRPVLILLGLLILLVVVQGAVLLFSGQPILVALQEVFKSFVIGGILLVLAGSFLLIILGRFEIAVPPEAFLFAGWLFGSLAFLNTWDFPIYLALLLGVVLWNQRYEDATTIIKRLLATAYGLGITGFLFYLPWYPGFRSQAGGVLPNLIFPTRLVHFFIMFAPLIVPIFFWLIWMIRRKRKQIEWRVALLVAAGIPLTLFVFSLILGSGIGYYLLSEDQSTFDTVVSLLGVPDQGSDNAFGNILGATLSTRIISSWTTIVLGAVVLMAFGLFIGAGRLKSSEEQGINEWVFVILMIIIGAILVLFPEYVYLQDTFGTRMNTIFKFYYGAWILWGLAAAYATVSIWPREFKFPDVLRALVIVPLLIGLMYPVLSIWTKTNGFKPALGSTLDGMAHLESRDPDEYQALLWINENLKGGVVAEAVGDSYTAYGRVATHTGLTTVLEWPGHELQWRNGYEEQGTRRDDISRLYTTRSWQDAKAIVDAYGIDYVFVGSLERSTYSPIDERKFYAFMDVIFENNGVIVFVSRDTGKF